MSSFRHLPLGERIPNREHAVSCSLPTMGSVIGYEEKDPAVTQHLSSGYPRFVKHPLLKRAAENVIKELGLKNQNFWPTASARAAANLRDWMSPIATEVLEHNGISGLAFPATADAFSKAKLYLQHTGKQMSSREAEDYLVRSGVLTETAPEAVFEGYAGSRVKGALVKAGLAPSGDDIHLANSGMNAIFSAFSAVNAIQRARGRTLWVQLGWLYLDTIEILKKFTGEAEPNYVFVNDVFDQQALRRLFALRGHEIAGVITEVPTNPLIQTTDLPALHTLCSQVGAALIADPTIACFANINILPHTDVLVTSLTKFTASEGDLTAGAIVLNQDSPWYETLRTKIACELEPIYSRDLNRLAYQIGDLDRVIARMNENTRRVVDFLSAHPKIESVYWTLQDKSRGNYLALARTPDAVGGMVTFTVKGDVTPFFDRLRMAKGPSFGMKNSLICPFMYLAHYELVTTEEGRAFLASSGLHPQLLRLSLGTEPAEEIIEVLGEALG